MTFFRFDYAINDIVDVQPAPKGRDPGGRGTVTAREIREDHRGSRTFYRVLIPGHVLQEKVARDKHHHNQGFWYASELLTPAGEGT